MTDWLRTEIILPPFERPPYESGVIYVQQQCADGGLSKRGFVAGETIYHLGRLWRPFVKSA